MYMKIKTIMGKGVVRFLLLLTVLSFVSANTTMAVYRFNGERGIRTPGEGYQEEYERPSIEEPEEEIKETKETEALRADDSDTGIIGAVGNFVSNLVSGVVNAVTDLLNPLFRAVNTMRNRSQINDYLDVAEDTETDAESRTEAINDLSDILMESPGIGAGLQNDVIDTLMGIASDSDEDYGVRREAYNQLGNLEESDYISSGNRDRIANELETITPPVWLSQWDDTVELESIQQGQVINIPAYRGESFNIVSESDGDLTIEIPQEVELEGESDSITLTDAEVHTMGPTEANDQYHHTVYVSGNIEADEDQEVGDYTAELPLTVTDEEGNVYEFTSTLEISVEERTEETVRLSGDYPVEIESVEQGEYRHFPHHESSFMINADDSEISVSMPEYMNLTDGSETLLIENVESFLHGPVYEHEDGSYSFQGSFQGSVSVDADQAPGVYTSEVPLIVTDSDGISRELTLPVEIEVEERTTRQLQHEELDLGSVGQGESFQMEEAGTVSFGLEALAEDWNVPETVEMTSDTGESFELEFDISSSRLTRRPGLRVYSYDVSANADIGEDQQPGTYNGSITIDVTDQNGTEYEKELDFSLIVEELGI